MAEPIQPPPGAAAAAAAAAGSPGAAPDLAGRRSNLSHAKRDLLARWLRGQPTAGAGAAAPIPRRAAGEPVPLSFAQQRIWFLDQLDPGSPAYNLGGALRLRGELDVRALAAAGGELVRRHEVLRTALVVVDGEPRQVVHPARRGAGLPLVDLGLLGGARREAVLAGLACAAVRQPIDLERGPLLRLGLARVAPHEHVLLLTLSHAAGDSWSLGLLIGELAALYQAFARRRPSPLPELPIQYADFAVWQRRRLAGDLLAEQLAWWRRQLDGAPPALELPADRPRPPARSGRGALLPVALEPDVARPLRSLCLAERTTFFAGLLAACQLLLHRLSGERTIVVGTPVANRGHVQLEKLVGFFANTLALRLDVAAGASFRELLRQAGETVRGALAHQDLPFERLVEELHPRRDLARTPVFQVMFVLQNAPMPPLAMAGLTMETLDLDPGTAKFDLTLTLADAAAGGAAGTLEYSSDLFDRDRMLRLRGVLERLAAAAAASPDEPAGELPLLSAAERHQLLREWNDSGCRLAGAATVHGLVAAQARRTPEAAAVVDRQTVSSYAELVHDAARLADRLRAAGVGRGSLVGIAVERSRELMVGLLGILECGAAYVPLDPDYPAERLRYMVEDSGIAVLLTAGERLAGLGGERVRRFDLRGAAASAAGAAAARTAGPAGGAAGAGDLVYAIYTSGSTGRPKGALNVHGAVVNRLLWMQETYRLTERDRVLQKTPCGFDVSVWELFWPLAAGAALVFAEPGGHRDSAYLARLVAEQSITVAHFVPSMLQPFLEEEESRRCASLRQVVVSGEALSAALRDRCLERLPAAALDNLYGPTEAAIDVSVWPCRPAAADAPVPIGRPIANLRLYVLDPARREAPAGIPGELCIGGAGLGRGYLRRPDLTAERFVPDACGEEPGARLYRTGDLARCRRDGAIEFLGRLDHQVKVRGVRIELGEIEATLLREPAVREAVVAARPGPAGETRLVAWVAGPDRAALLPERLRAAVAHELPEAMVPAVFVVLDALPLGAHGKVDRQALPDPVPAAGAAPGEAGFELPRNAREAAVAAIWTEILGVPRVGIHDDFFALGGHSIAAARMLQALRRAFRVELPLRLLFQRPTVAALAAAIAAPRPGGAAAAAPGLPYMGRDELAAQAHLGSDFVVAAAVRAVAPMAAAGPGSPPARVLLTGATGFLGPFLLHQLLVQLPGARIDCLVRAADPALAEQRVRSGLAACGLWEESFAGRLRGLPGDLARPLLGLAPQEIDRLAADVDAIYHNGAWVNLFLGYPTLAPANVAGTREVLRLAARGRPKPVHHVGTVSVFASAGGAPLAAVDETTPLDAIHGLLGGYSQSKWVAESLVRQAAERGVQATVYRLGRVAPHSGSGRGNFGDLLFRMLRGSLEIGAAPDLETEVEMAPVDYVSGALVHLSRQPAAAGAVYHLVHPRPVTWRRLLDALDAAAAPRRPLARLPATAWEEAIRRAAESSGSDALHALLPFLGDAAAAAGDAPVATQPAVRCRRTLAALAGSSWRCPPLDDRLLGLYLRRLTKGVTT